MSNITLKTLAKRTGLSVTTVSRALKDGPEINIKTKKRPFWKFYKPKEPQLILDGGWHFSFLKKPKDIANKIREASPPEATLFNESGGSSFVEENRNSKSSIPSDEISFSLKETIQEQFLIPISFKCFCIFKEKELDNFFLFLDKFKLSAYS